MASIISAMVNDPLFQKAIKEKIGTAVDTDELEKQRDSLFVQLRQANGIKLRVPLEQPKT